MTPKQLIKHYGDGNLAATGDAIGVTRQCVHNWLRTGRVSAQWQAWVEKDTKGVLKADGKKPRRG